MSVRPSTRLKTMGGVLGPVEIESLLGTGGMAAVYRAKRLDDKSLVAIKVINPQVSGPELVERFKREARIGQMLDDEGVIRVFESGEEHGHLYMVMSLAEGGDLKKRSQAAGKMDWREAVRYSSEIAKALAHSHSRGIMHRDLKPANIFMTTRGEPRLGDFGLAMIHGEGPHLEENTTNERQVLVGTPAYMSPEQFRRPNGVDARSDLYSLGCLLYELLAGRKPFDGEDYNTLQDQHERAEPESLKRIRDDLPPLLVELVERLMAKKPDWRYESAGMVAQDLQGILSGKLRALTDEELPRSGELVVPSVKVTTVVSSSAKAPREIPWPWIMIAAVVLFAGSAVGYLALDTQSEIAFHEEWNQALILERNAGDDLDKIKAACKTFDALYQRFPQRQELRLRLQMLNDRVATMEAKKKP